MDINLGENLKTLRIRSRRTLEDVAEIIDVSRQLFQSGNRVRAIPI